MAPHSKLPVVSHLMQNKISSPPNGPGGLALPCLSCFIDLISLYFHLFPKAQPSSAPFSSWNPAGTLLPSSFWLFPLQDSPCPHLVGFRSLLQFILIRRFHCPHKIQEQTPPSPVSLSPPALFGLIALFPMGFNITFFFDFCLSLFTGTYISSRPGLCIDIIQTRLIAACHLLTSLNVCQWMALVGVLYILRKEHLRIIQ